MHEIKNGHGMRQWSWNGGGGGGGGVGGQLPPPILSDFAQEFASFLDAYLLNLYSLGALFFV